MKICESGGTAPLFQTSALDGGEWSAKQTCFPRANETTNLNNWEMVGEMRKVM
jgi:hypothetical protein